MRVIPTAPQRPNHCAVVSTRHHDEEGFVDTGSELPGFDNHVYISVTALREMAKLINLTDPSVNERTIELLSERVAKLEQEVTEADAFIAAVGAIRTRDQARRQVTSKPPKVDSA